MDNKTFLYESIAASFQKMVASRREDATHMSKTNAKKALERANIYAMQAYMYKRRAEQVMVIG